MNIALSAVLIFILLLPSVAFYLAFTFGQFPKAGPKISLLEGLMMSGIFSIILHTIAISFIDREIRFDILAMLLGGDLKTFGNTIGNNAFKTIFTNFVFYNAILVTLSVTTARIARFITVYTGMHGRSELLRLYNSWWYIFHGYKVDEYIEEGKPAPFDIVFVDALVDTNDGTMIYSGYLIDFVCSGETLDRIYLSETNKRAFKENEQNDKGIFKINEPGEPKAIDGDTMSIPYSSIINMNLHFLTFPADLLELENVSSHEVSSKEDGK